MVPSAPVLGVAEALDADPGMVAEVPYPPLGSVRMLKNPVRFGADEADYRPPPALGEHTEEVLVEVLGLAPAEVAALVGNGSAAGPVTGQ
jgi:crotonobetainyl-CoA:carnitine CoA-transferase CaiB-like acyl-CoA transferase